jgi:hypothetical protein
METACFLSSVSKRLKPRLLALERRPDRLELLIDREEFLDLELRLDRLARSMGPNLN